MRTPKQQLKDAREGRWYAPIPFIQMASIRQLREERMAIHVYDGNSWHKVADIDSAKKACLEAIDAAREVAKYDNERPDWVESIRAYEAPDDTESPEEFPCILKTVETNVKRPSSKLDEEGFDDNGDWWPDSDAYNCDYDVEEIHHAK